MTRPRAAGPPRRAGRRTNVALLALLPAAFATGWLAFGTGTVWPARVVTVAHAVLGLAIVALVPWKQLIARRSLARRRSGVVVGSLSLLLALLVVLSLVAGFAHSYGGRGSSFGLSAMQIHVGAALLAVPLFVAHLFTRPQRVRRTDLSRRNTLRLGALLGAGALAFVALEGLAVVAGLPGRRRRVTGSYEQGTDDPAAMPLTSWLFDSIPAVDVGSSVVVVAGRRVGYAELAAGTDEVRAVLDCTGGWYAEQTWRGIRLDRLLGIGGGAGTRGGAGAGGGVGTGGAGRTIVVTSVTGYSRRFPAAEASSLWLATHAAGLPLDAGHGAPARLVAPGRRGFWWVKWVATITMEDTPDWWQPPFPLQ